MVIEVGGNILLRVIFHPSTILQHTGVKMVEGDKAGLTVFGLT